MRKRFVTFRVNDAEYQNLKAEAEKAGISVPLHARRLALEGVQIAPRLDSLERLIQDIPGKAVLLEAFQRLGAKIDRAGTGKGGAS